MIRPDLKSVCTSMWVPVGKTWIVIGQNETHVSLFEFMLYATWLIGFTESQVMKCKYESSRVPIMAVVVFGMNAIDSIAPWNCCVWCFVYVESLEW